MRPWWQPRGVLCRYVVDLLADELARLRRRPVPMPGEWRDEWRLDEDLGADSLELMTLATALAEALHLHESGIEDCLLARRTLGDWVAIAEAGLTRFSDRLTFRTSGSTGVPKPCVHLLENLRQETQHLSTLLPGRRRVLCAVPSHHIYGFLFSVLLPRDLGLYADGVIDIRASTPAWLARGAQPGDLVIAHPDYWQMMGRTVTSLPEDVVGITSTAPCPDGVSEAVEATGIARLMHVYGSSETAGIGARDSHRGPYALFPYWKLNGEQFLRQMPNGSQQAIEVQDRLEPCGEGHFLVGRRHDAAVQVGGINVFPSRVIEVLKRHPAVDDAAVRLMHPHEGGRLKAFIVPKQRSSMETKLLTELHAWIDRELTAPERPKALRLGDSLPTTPAGKLADWSLQD